MNTMTGSAWQLHTDNIRISPFTGQLTLDSIRLVSTDPENRYPDITVSKIVVRGILWEILFPSSTLQVSEIRVSGPSVKVHRPQEGRQANADHTKLLFQLKNFFSGRIHTLRIKNLIVESAVVNHYLPTGDLNPFRYIRSFDLLVKNFETGNRILSANEFYEAEKVDFRVRNFSRMLGDQKHQAKVGEFTWSMQEKKIRGKNITVSPAGGDQTEGTSYQVSIPSLEIELAGPGVIAGEDTINLRSVNIGQCRIRIRPSGNTDGTSLRELRDFDLYKLFKDDFRLLRIGRLSMDSPEMHFDSRSGNDSVYQKFRHVRISMEGFRLDSASWADTLRVLYADRFDLSVGSYILRFNDQVHRLSAGNIHASSSDSLIRAQNIHLDRMESKLRLPATVRLSCDSVSLTAVDFRRLYNSREMPVKEIAAYRPEVAITRYETGTSRSEARDHQSLLYHFIGNYIKGVYANKVTVNQGHFAVNDLQNLSDKGIIEANINFTLNDFEIDSVTARQTEKLFFASDLTLVMNDYNMKLADEIHRLQVQQVSLSSSKKEVSVRGFHLFPDKQLRLKEAMYRLQKTELYEIKVPELRLQQIDINRAFFNKKLLISRFFIQQPEIDVELFGAMKRKEKEFNFDEFYDLIKNYLIHIEIGEIETSQGDIRLVNHSRKGKTVDLTNRFSLHLDHFILNDEELDKNRLLFSDDFDLTLKDHLFRLSDNVHVLKAEQISFSSRDKSVVVSGANLYPLISSPAFGELPWHLIIKIPLIRLEQADINQINLTRTLQVGHVSVESPEIEIFRNIERPKANFKDPEIPLPGDLRELNIGEVYLSHGSLKVYRNTEARQRLIAGAGIDFHIRGASLKRVENRSNARFSSANTETRLTNLRFDPGKISYSLSSGLVSFSSTDSLLQFQNLYIWNTAPGQNKGIEAIQVPSLRFEGLDPVDAFENNRFHALEIDAEHPVFRLNSGLENRRSNPFHLRLPAGLQPFMDELSAGKVKLFDASFVFSGKKTEERYSGIHLLLEGLRLDSLQSDRLLGAEKLTVFKTGIQFSDKEKYYDIRFDSLLYTSTASRLILSGIHILPRYSKKAFQRVVPFQTDRYSGTIARASLTHVDLDRWFARRELTARSVVISEPKIEIYRDKRTLFNPRQFRPMPQDMMNGIQTPFRFDSVRIAGASVNYTEQQENRQGTGIAKFTGLNVTLSPLTNRFQKNEMLKIKAESGFMDSSTLNAEMDFDMNSPRHLFQVKGSLSPFALSALNPVTEAGAGILIRSGNLNRFDFNFQGDSVKAAGKLWFAYDDLKISVMEQKNGDTREAKWLSFLANTLMLKSKNPRTKILSPDSIYFERNPQRSIINYWWKSVFSGAKNTFGIKEGQKEETP